MAVNELRCDGVRLVFRTGLKSLDLAVEELESRLAYFGIDAELSGMMSLYGEDDRLLEVC